MASSPTAPVVPPVTRVSSLELFFDLVFVFTITQLTAVLVHEPTLTGLLQVVLMLGVIWWMYDGYAWLTNAVAPDRPSRRLVLLAAMAAYLVLALAVPQAFRGGGLAFGIAYLAIVGIHLGMFSRTASVGVVEAVVQLAPFNVISGVLVLVGGALGGTAQYVLWAVAFGFEWVTPLFTTLSGFRIGTAHFVERHGLVMLVALGESVVAVGIGASGAVIDVSLVVIAVLGLVVNAGLWWTYFGDDDDDVERALERADPAARGWLAVQAFGYWHLALLLGVILVAAGLEPAIAHGYDTLDAAQAVMLAGGLALFLVGDVGFRWSLGLPVARTRIAAAAAALATIPLGTQVAEVLQLGALVAVLAVMIAAERPSGQTAAP
jgi:low temperature requirement protein LtrA